VSTRTTGPTAARTGGRAAAALVVAAAAVVGGACSGAPPPSFVIDLAGQHRVHDGDQPRFADPDFDDRGWARTYLPDTWRRYSVWMPPNRWYRIHFNWPAGAPRDDLALSLGMIGWADQTFLNGTVIGATGDLEQVPDLAYQVRQYAIPPALLRPGDNVIAIRSQGGPLGANGLMSDHIGIGHQRELTRTRTLELARASALECVLLGFVLFVWLLLAVVPKRGVTGRAALFLWLTVTMQMIHLSLGSVTARQIGLELEGTTQWRFLALCTGLGGLWAFVALIARGRVPHLVKGMCGVVWILGVLVTLMTVLGAAADIAAITLLVLAVRARTAGAVPALVGYVGAFVLIWTMLAARPFIAGVAAYYFGIGFLAAGALVALARQSDLVRRRAQRASEYALAAHASERTRLARDLHDGVGQMMALLKMQLQRTGHRLDDAGARSALDEGVAQVDAALEELRRVARDLRPTPMEERGFGEAVRDYAAGVARRSGLEVVVTGDLDGPLPEGVGDELYRIVQECLTNCVKHGRASRVELSMIRAGESVTLTVTDDGRGLPAQAAGDGIGLQTIRERSELMGGTCRFSEPEGGGTRVTIHLPRPMLVR